MVRPSLCVLQYLKQRRLSCCFLSRDAETENVDYEVPNPLPVIVTVVTPW